MTKWSVFPRAFGTFPAGSAVRVKSRFALYSARAFPDADGARPAREALADVFRTAEAALPVRPPRLAAAPDPTLAPFFATLLARVTAFRAVARFTPVREPARLVAMPLSFARSMPPAPVADCLPPHETRATPPFPNGRRAGPVTGRHQSG